MVIAWYTNSAKEINYGNNTVMHLTKKRVWLN